MCVCVCVCLFYCARGMITKNCNALLHATFKQRTALHYTFASNRSHTSVELERSASKDVRTPQQRIVATIMEICIAYSVKVQ